MVGSHTELRFEDAIEVHLLANGWVHGSPGNYRAALGLDTAELFTFIGATQPEEWERLVGLHGGADVAQRKFAERVASEISSRGTVDVLRRGVVDLGVRITMAYFRPAHEITQDLLRLYEANRCTLTRQVHFSEQTTDKSLDLMLSVNGLPVATAELKNPLTNQDVHHAIRQYREDRKPTELLFAKRAVVHFAVDPDEVYLTTRLEGRSTRFLPFNQGSGGPGQSGGAGNPPHPSGYSSAYLWEQVWQRDAWLDLLARYIHVEAETSGKGKKPLGQRPVVFPRFHQWHAVRSLAGHAAVNGAGTNYLVQHSAGSGKSNTIAWLAHRLSTLHTPADPALITGDGLAPNTKVFDKVVVITDRVVLDRQLQDTIFQFDHTIGVVKKIDESSAQLAEALAGETAKVIITTLQKFPFILDQARDALAGSRFAIVVDEAHSSQTGESAKALKAVLGQAAREVVAVGHGQNSIEAAYDAAVRLESKIEAGEDPQDLLAASVAARGRQPNLSFFAFTATPKAKTLELFGTTSPLDGLHRPVHLYSMRQAIEEKFILDVLKNYVTYSTYFKLANASTEDPEVDQRKATAELARFVSLHPTNLAQKAEVIVEHFRRVTAKKIAGQGKAMVVTRSRLHAVKCYEAIKRYIAEHGYADCRPLVAFSGTVIDPELGEDVTYTETFLNGFSESQTAERFATPEYQVLIVAEKFQTGFDQPLLHTMYVDKKLEGVKAVQTLSRLNRMHPGKDDTFILDFANTAEDIQAAFKPFYDVAVVEPTDPNLLYNASARVDAFQVIDSNDVTALVSAYLAISPEAKASAHAALYKFTEPARDRYQDLGPPDREEFRSALRDYVRMYAFLAQVLPFTDTQLEALYLYGRFLLPRLPREHDGAVDLGDDVVLAALRTETTGTFDVSLGAGEGEQQLPMAFTGDGAGPQNERKRAALSTIIETLNDKFGTNLTQADQLWVEQQVTAAVEDPEIRAGALANTEENFKFTFDRLFEGRVIDRHDANGEMLRRFLDQPDFADLFTAWARGETYRQIREQAEGA
jgi:type I restriction enzyme R subunit